MPDFSLRSLRSDDYSPFFSLGDFLKPRNLERVYKRNHHGCVSLAHFSLVVVGWPVFFGRFFYLSSQARLSFMSCGKKTDMMRARARGGEKKRERKASCYWIYCNSSETKFRWLPAGWLVNFYLVNILSFLPNKLHGGGFPDLSTKIYEALVAITAV